MGDLVDVDFTAKRQPFSLGEDLLREVNAIKSGLDRLKLERIFGGPEWRARILRSRLRRARRELQEERAANEPTDGEVLASLVELGSVASATQVAETLYRHGPTHSGVIRVGLSLARLASSGRVRRVVVSAHGRHHNRWEAALDV